MRPFEKERGKERRGRMGMLGRERGPDDDRHERNFGGEGRT